MKKPTKAAAAFMQSLIDDAGRDTYSDALPLALLEKLAVNDNGITPTVVTLGTREELEAFSAKRLAPAN